MRLLYIYFFSPPHYICWLKIMRGFVNSNNSPSSGFLELIFLAWNQPFSLTGMTHPVCFHWPGMGGFSKCCFLSSSLSAHKTACSGSKKRRISAVQLKQQWHTVKQQHDLQPQEVSVDLNSLTHGDGFQPNT